MRGHSRVRRRSTRPGRRLRSARKATGAVWAGLVQLDPAALDRAGLRPVPVGPDALALALVAMRRDALLVSTTRPGSLWPGLRIPIEAVAEVTTGGKAADERVLALRLDRVWVHLPVTAGGKDLVRAVDSTPEWAAKLPVASSAVTAAELLERHDGGQGRRSRRHSAPPDVRGKRRRLLRATALVLLGIMLLIGYAVTNDRLRTAADDLRADGVRTTGVVTTLYPDTPQMTGRIEVNFTVDGVPHSGGVDLGARVVDYRAGQRLSTWYDPADPERITIAGVDARPTWSVAAGVAAAVVGVMGVLAGLVLAAGSVRTLRRSRGRPAVDVASRIDAADRIRQALARLPEQSPVMPVPADLPLPTAPGRLVVVGAGDVTTALAALAGLLGWQAVVVDGAAEAEAAIAPLGPNDSVVVLSHDDGTDGPALAAALAGKAGHVAAMGSRRTQRRRREWLLAQGVSEAAVDSVRGPAGLDIGADTSAEIALAIAAEIVAVHRGRTTAGSISDRGGPIHPALPADTALCPGG